MAHTREFTDEIWNKGRKVTGHNPDEWRKDQCGAWIKKSEYRNRDSDFGWEVDRISVGGPFSKGNCRPLHYDNYLAKGNGNLKCRIIGSESSTRVPMNLKK